MTHTACRILLVLAVWVGAVLGNPAFAFDHTHRAWNDLLAKHVVVAAHGNASAVRYRALRADRAALDRYLAELSRVPAREFDGWTKPQRLAFLINAYNAWTVDLILRGDPGLKSIKDLGNVFRSPWKKNFFTLLGQERNLDDIEHGMIRAPGAYDDPRIHFAVVCASIGCPMLRPDAFVAERLDAQLEDGMRRFLSDRTRNRFDAGSRRMKISKIFDWYGKDFEQGHQGMASLKAALARHAEALAATPADLLKIRAGDYEIEFLEYDWALNDAR